MDLFIVRHGIAADIAPGGRDDLRPLTERGVDRFQREVAGLRALELELDRIYHSPWLRAVQTAELLGALGAPLEETPHLAADPSPDLLEQLRGLSSVAVVGHEPWMGELTAWLAFGEAALSRPVVFKKGGVAWLQGDPVPGQMWLRGFWNPRLLRALGDAAS
jgi:phosphohistidine phosphatase